MPQPPNRQPEATRLESADEIRQAIQARQAERAAKAQPRPAARPAPAAGARPAPPAPPPPAEPDAEAEVPTERPQFRPPMALLCILDDGNKMDGEWVRLRGDRYVIGRAEADIRIPHDAMMSGQHGQLVRQKTKDGVRWVLSDLGSTNGSWVRIGKTLLQHGSELLLGRGQYRFEVPAAAGTLPEPPGAPAGATQAWGGGPVTSMLPALVEMTPAGPGARYPLTLPEYWIGRDPAACAIARPDDPYLNARHARLHRDASGQWHAENHRSVNGLWLRVEEMALGGTCQIRMGEQRFLFRVV
jgi:hypothetical protein